MKIILGGYGTMSKIVEALAKEKNHEIVGIFSLLPVENTDYSVFDKVEELAKINADVIIDFSHPSNTTALLEGAEKHKLPIVVATTGEREKIKLLMDEAANHCPVFFSANMSYGVHIFTELLKFLTPLLSDSFDIEIIEKHHNQKIDAPSGTAIKLLEAIQKAQSNAEFEVISDRTKSQEKRKKSEIGMSVVRGGTIVGEHEVIFAGTDEVLEITHRAQSKKIFAEGAIKAAEKLVKKSKGFYTFENL